MMLWGQALDQLDRAREQLAVEQATSPAKPRTVEDRLIRMLNEEDGKTWAEITSQLGTDNGYARSIMANLVDRGTVTRTRSGPHGGKYQFWLRSPAK